MTSPAAPESETPEFDALLDDLTLQVEHESIEPGEYDKRIRDFARSLERRLAQAQARVAELEKLLVDAQENLIWCGGSTDFGPGGQAKIGYDKGPRTTIAAIFEALKDRA